MSNKNNDIQDGNDDTTKNWSVGRPGVFNSRWVAIFVPLIGYLISGGSDVPIGIIILALMFIWWFFLGVFWVLPVFSYFDAEKNWISNYRRKSKASYLKKQIVTGGFYFVYWPVFLPKEFIFWCIVLIVIVVNFIRFIGD